MGSARSSGSPRHARDLVRLEEARETARARGGRLLSRRVRHCMAKVWWQCAKGHRWRAIAIHVTRAGTWCAQCGKSTIEDMRGLAAKRGGECLSSVYVNAQTKLQWRCAQHHVWWSKPNHVRYRWCPDCSRVRKLELKDIRRIAVRKGGRLLSTHYVNCRTPLLWRCANGHTWWAKPVAVKPGKHRPGTWCRKCVYLSRRGRRAPPVTIDDLREIARQRGGKCLSDHYFYTTKLKWRCARGHEWMTRAAIVKQGAWCPVCSNRQLEFRQALATAARHGGKVLSSQSKFTNGSSVLRWQCAAGHRFKDSLRRVRDGRWCPRCAAHRPLTLKDMRKMARERGGQCLSKRYVNFRTPLRWRCARGHIWKAAPHGLKGNRYGRGHWCPVCALTPKHSLQEMQAVARARGGECLSKRVGTAATELLWRCGRGHVWKAPPNRINRGRWCRRCAHDRRKLTIEMMQALARTKGGQCLSKKYVNNRTLLRWRCAKGHTFTRRADRARRLIQRKSHFWCPVCDDR